MDYCTSCRRHLNGALVCPGCGAYAPDIAPATIDSRVVPAPATGTTTGSVMLPMVPTVPAATWEYGAMGGGWQEGTPAHGLAGDGFATDEYATEQLTTDGFTADRLTADGFAADRLTANGFAADRLTANGFPADRLAAEAPAAGLGGDGAARSEAPLTETSGIEDVDVDADVDVEGVPTAPQGRAARRRQLARWKKNQRRAVVATAVALVGGGLTVIGMDRQSTDRTQAATAPDAESLGGVKEQGSQRGRTSATETDDTRRTSNSPTKRSPGTSTSRDRSAADTPNSREGTPSSPRTAASTPSGQQARTGSSTTGKTATDAATGTPTDETTTPPATDDAGSSTDTGTGTDTSTGTDSGSGSDAGSDTGTDTSDGSSSDTATTSPSGLCLLGIVCVS
ncbi:SCO2400 family protein [Streptomyces sp. DSM 40750]|uniref:SCO2400 family protein n=1 Tax=Streptomyces sp. DSM 40750 TaxID=2801030 RepID=UPI00214BE259|nr:hypothetical protein [Streptomyces sp. DSM 40750]UUU23635.1 hypothetical protein JIX55_27120 [Streptomyces sp. DSM 40750]